MFEHVVYHRGNAGTTPNPSWGITLAARREPWGKYTSVFPPPHREAAAVREDGHHLRTYGTIRTVTRSMTQPA